MRLRLDKLVLSAGLALAMVATSIPAIAGTTTTTTNEQTGLSLNGTSVTIGDNAAQDAFATAILGITEGDAAATVTGYSGTVTSVSVAESDSGTSTAPGDVITNQGITDGYEVASNATGSLAKKYVVSVESTYTKTISVDASEYITEATTDPAADAVNTISTNFEDLSKVIAAKEEADTNIKASTSDNQVTTVEAATAALTNPTAVAAYTEKAQAKAVSVTITKKSTTKYTVDELKGGYTYDLLFENLDVTNEYKVYKKDKTSGVKVSEVAYEIVNKTGGTEALKVSLTDLDENFEYYVGSKEVSTSGNLFFGDDEDGEDSKSQDIKVTDTVTLTVSSTATPVDSADFDTVAKANNAKIAGYFTADLSAGTYTDSEVTVKIVKPKDIEALAGEGKTIKYTVIRQHTGLPIEALETNSDGEYITFSSKYFSTFALAYEIVDATTEEETNNETNNETESATEAGTETTTAGGTSTTSTTTSTKTADNSMMPLFMTTLLLALCAGSLAIYKEKKTN